jgi:catechol 2,3-dioxygenase-like lactoylglutathione lyase family enzyme/quinol monooxygenase YgiN
MSILSIWESRFPTEHTDEGLEVTRSIWADMRRFAGYECHKVVQDLDDPGHLIVISRWVNRERADAAMSYASHRNAIRANELVSEPRRRTVAIVVDTRPTDDARIELDHLVIAVSDWERSNAFYRDVLGAELIELPRRRWAYRVGRQLLNVHGPGSAPQPVAREPVTAGNSDLCFAWPGSADEAVEHLRRHGAEVIGGPVERQGARGKGHSVYFRDPDGSLLEFISYDG